MKWILRFLFFLSLSLSAWSFDFTRDFKQGFYWSQLPLDFKVIGTNEAQISKLLSMSQTAASEWENATGLKIWNIHHQDESETLNTIRISSNFAEETNMDPQSVLAITIRYNSVPYFTRSEIIINSSHPLMSHDFFVLTTLIHELGHTIGLDHSNVLEAVMYPQLLIDYVQLHEDDIEGMQAVYQATLSRQATGYISPLLSGANSSTSVATCGSLGVASTQSSGSLISLIVGLLTGLITRLRRVFNLKSS